MRADLPRHGRRRQRTGHKPCVQHCRHAWPRRGRCASSIYQRCDRYGSSRNEGGLVCFDRSTSFFGGASGGSAVSYRSGSGPAGRIRPATCNRRGSCSGRRHVAAELRCAALRGSSVATDTFALDSKPGASTLHGHTLWERTKRWDLSGALRGWDRRRNLPALRGSRRISLWRRTAWLRILRGLRQNLRGDRWAFQRRQDVRQLRRRGWTRNLRCLFAAHCWRGPAWRQWIWQRDRRKQHGVRRRRPD